MDLKIFSQLNLLQGIKALFEDLKVPMNYVADEPTTAKEILKDTYKQSDTFQQMDDVYFVGMVDDAAFEGNKSLDVEKIKSDYDGLLIFGVELKERDSSRLPTRGHLAEITRAFNREFHYTPVVVVFRYGKHITLAAAERLKYQQSWREGEKAGKVSLIKDINIEKPHAGHERILMSLKIPPSVKTFKQLYDHWLQAFDVNILNKQFYQKLFNWYLWALKEVKFPQIRPEKDLIDDKVHQSESLIRLLTRLLFVWFMKEKGLIGAHLFNPEELKTILKGFVGNECDQTIFYKAILQNLFFATLNQPIEKRKIIGKEKKYNPDYGNPLVYRFDELFIIPESIHQYFTDIPFLNGGLFECLDQRKDSENSIEIRLDGFSTIESKQVHLPDKYFFGEYFGIDLSSDYDDQKKKNLTVFGIIDILDSYKFTIEESTPIEKEIALDPELLGKVFENLLASYNPETQTTARKQTGSFYTPPEIVNYMVDESLIQHLKSVVDDEERLRELFSYEDLSLKNPFNDTETKALIQSIDNCKILDPACGSGAFPMGALQKMTHVLHKLDPENKIWFEMVIGNLPTYMQAEARRKLEKENWNYVRKLGIIQQCLYGVDIQPIAVQISKLRFFISLLVDQEGKPGEPNMGYEPLPNLDFKLVAANTLIPAPENDAIDVYAIGALESFEKLSNEYFSAISEKKTEIKTEIKSIISKIVDANQFVVTRWVEQFQRERNSAKPSRRKHIERQLQAYQKALNLWNTFPNLYKNESVGFFETRFFFPQVKEGFDIVIGNPPYIQMQKDGGKLANELKNLGYETFERTGDVYCIFYERGVKLLKSEGVLSYITSNKWMRAGYGKTTRAFLLKHQPVKLIDLGSGVFETATVDTNILLVQRTNEPPNQSMIKALDLSKEQESRFFDHGHAQWIELYNLNTNSWNISNPIEQRIREKIENRGIPLKDWGVNIYRGVLTGYNEAFIIDGKKRSELIAEDPKSAEIIKPLLRGRDIKRYRAEFADLWLIDTHNGYVDDSGQKIPPVDVSWYPAVKQHLKLFYPQLQQRQDQGKTPYNLRNCAYHQEFGKQKIIFQEMVQDSCFCIDKKNHYFCLDTGRIITGENLGFLACVMNSKLFFFSIKHYYGGGALGEKGVRMKHTFFENFPIPKLKTTEQTTFLTHLEKLIEDIEQYPYANTTALENRIDELVFKLYDLTYEEVKVIVPDFWLREEEYEGVE